MAGNDGYEIHSILEFGDVPTPGLWWVLSPNGKSPTIRAGAASLVQKGDRPFDESLVISGGATPAGFINQVTKLDLVKGEWVQLSTSGFEPRYEHAMIEVDSQLTVLLGTGNGEIRSQSFDNDKWTPTGLDSISKRTISQQAQYKTTSYIWSGGCEQGVVSDTSLYIIQNGSVRKEKLCGDIPSPRQEFAMCADENFLYIHGGISAAGLKLKDLFKINLSNFRSKRLTVEGAHDMTRAMHKMIVYQDFLYIFGGLVAGEQGVISDELIKLSAVEGRNAVKAEQIKFETKPTPRIAFNFHIVDMPIRKNRLSVPHAEENAHTTEEPIIKPVDDWKVTIDGENVALPDTGDNSRDD